MTEYSKSDHTNPSADVDNNDDLSSTFAEDILACDKFAEAMRIEERIREDERMKMEDK